MLSGGCAVGQVSIFGCVVLLGVVLLGARLCRSWVIWNAEDDFLRIFVIL